MTLALRLLLWLAAGLAVTGIAAVSLQSCMVTG